MTAHGHWAGVYASKAVDSVSWYQERPALSLSLIEAAGARPDSAIIDVGAGASTLVDHLIAAGHTDITLLDISETALETARARIGDRSASVRWLVGDITTIALESARYDLWHDRAVFHFLTDPAQQRRYVAQVQGAVKPGGTVIMATFALDGPEQCSGLTTARYDAESLYQVFGTAFEQVSTMHETHITPWGSEQKFVYCVFRKV